VRDGEPAPSPTERGTATPTVWSMSIDIDIGQYKLNRTCFADKFVSSLTTGFMDRACFAYEVIAIREGQLTLMHDDFYREEADDIIAYLVT